MCSPYLSLLEGQANQFFRAEKVIRPHSRNDQNLQVHERRNRLNSDRLTVFDDKNLGFLGREERRLGFGTQTQRHVSGKTTERTHPCRCRCRW